MTDNSVRRVAIGLEYCGVGYHGWQRQPTGPSVQAAVEYAIGEIAGQPVVVVGAGRTDRGVHATWQVIHADLPASRPMTAWLRGVNSHLPKDIAVNWAIEVSPDFHARFSARGRAYRYELLNRPSRPGVAHGLVGWTHRPLLLEAMRGAAGRLLGRHDFSAFRAAECQARTPVRELRRLDVRQNGERFVFTLEADAFLHHMVRNIVGTLVMIGNGSRSPEWAGELLESRNRNLAAPTFAPDGLYLSGVDYDPVWGLPRAPAIDGEPA